MARRERSDGARRYPGEASKFVRGSSSSPGGGAGAGAARRRATAGGATGEAPGNLRGLKGAERAPSSWGKAGWWLCFDRGRRLGSLGGTESGVRLWGGNNFQFSLAL